MGYIEQSLARSERLVYRAHFHWLYTAAAWSLLLLALIAAIAVYQRGFPLAAVALCILGIILFLAILIPIWSQQIAVTDQRLIYRRGLVRRATHELQLRAVEEVSVQQGILGRILGFGRLTVNGTGEQEIDLPALADPVTLRQKIQEAMSPIGARGQPPPQAATG